MLISTVECKEGMWTGRPDLGFWCSKPAPPVKGSDSGAPLLKRTNDKSLSAQQFKPVSRRSKRSVMQSLMLQ